MRLGFRWSALNHSFSYSHLAYHCFFLERFARYKNSAQKSKNCSYRHVHDVLAMGAFFFSTASAIQELYKKKTLDRVICPLNESASKKTLKIKIEILSLAAFCTLGDLKTVASSEIN